MGPKDIRFRPVYSHERSKGATCTFIHLFYFFYIFIYLFVYSFIYMCSLLVSLNVCKSKSVNLQPTQSRWNFKIYDKRDDFDLDIVNFPFLDGDVLRRSSYGVYISQLIRFARASSNHSDFNYRNKALTAKLHRQGHRYFKLCKAFSKYYRRQYVPW